MLARVTSELKFHRSGSRMHSEQPVKTPAYSTESHLCSAQAAGTAPSPPSCRCPARPPPPLSAYADLALPRPPSPAVVQRAAEKCPDPDRQTDRQPAERSGAQRHGGARGAAHRSHRDSPAGPGTARGAPRRQSGPGRNRDPRPTPHAGPTGGGLKDRPQGPARGLARFPTARAAAAKPGRGARPLGSGRTCTARLRKVPASAASFFMLKSMMFIFGGGGRALTQPGHPQRRPPLRPVPARIRRGAVPAPDAATDWPRPRRQAQGPDRQPKWRRRSPRAAVREAPGRCARLFPPLEARAWGRAVSAVTARCVRLPGVAAAHSFRFLSPGLCKSNRARLHEESEAGGAWQWEVAKNLWAADQNALLVQQSCLDNHVQTQLQVALGATALIESTFGIVAWCRWASN